MLALDNPTTGIDVATTLWNAFLIVVPASVFFFGFLSVRQFASLDRALERAADLDDAIRHNPPNGPIGLDRAKADLQYLEDLGKQDLVSRATVYGNAVAAVALLVLAHQYGADQHWHCTSLTLDDTCLPVGNQPPGFWAITIVLCLEFGTAILGFLENWFIAKRVNQAKSHFLAHHLHEADEAFGELMGSSSSLSEKELEQVAARADNRYQNLVDEIPEWAYVHAQLGLVKLKRADIPLPKGQAKLQPELQEADLDAAIEHLTQACNAASPQRDWRIALIRAQLRRGNLQPACEELQRFLNDAKPRDVAEKDRVRQVKIAVAGADVTSSGEAAQAACRQLVEKLDLLT